MQALQVDGALITHAYLSKNSFFCIFENFGQRSTVSLLLSSYRGSSFYQRSTEAEARTFDLVGTVCSLD